MKPLSETYKELGIAFVFPIEIRDTKGRRTYYEDSDGFWFRHEQDADGNETYFENDDGYWRKREHDSNGNQTYYENSHGYKEGTPITQIKELRKELDEATHLNQAISMLASLPRADEMDTLVKDGKRLDWLFHEDNEMGCVVIHYWDKDKECYVERILMTRSELDQAMEESQQL